MSDQASGLSVRSAKIGPYRGGVTYLEGRSPVVYAPCRDCFENLTLSRSLPLSAEDRIARDALPLGSFSFGGISPAAGAVCAATTPACRRPPSHPATIVWIIGSSRHLAQSPD